MNLRNLLFSAITAVALVGCGGDSPKDTSALQEAFAKDKATTPEAKQLQGLAESAATAAAKGDFEQAAASLIVLQAEQKLTPAQRSAVQDQMSNVQTDLTARAEGGDANAQRALDAIRKMRSR